MGKQFIVTTDKRGQLTFPKEVLKHLGLQSGGKLKVGFLPDGILKFSPILPQSREKASRDMSSSSPKPAGLRDCA